MEELEGKTPGEMLRSKIEQLKAWLKPNPADSVLVTSLKMIYKVAAVLLLILFSPVILVVLGFVFFAAF